MLPILCKDSTFLDHHGLLKTGHIAIQDGFIKAVYPAEVDPLREDHFEEVIPSASFLIMPGLMNCHTHIPMVLFRGLGDDLPLSEWLNTKIFPLEEKLNDEAVYFSTLVGIAELLHNGCTFFSDMYFFIESIAKACAVSGMRANLSLGLMDPKGDNGIQQSIDLYHHLKEYGDHKITFFLGPHAPYTCSPDYLKKVIRAAEDLDTGIHIHLNETESEVANFLAVYHCRPIELLNEIGLFERPVVAAHCVHTSEQERLILRDHTVLVVHNPSSNCKLASGIAPIDTYAKLGIRMGIGTDGAASNNQLNLFKEIHLASLLSKVSEKSATSFSHQEFYPLLYHHPASFFFPHQPHGIQPGGKADLIFIQKEFSRLFPQENILSHLMYAMQGNEVEHVMIDGKWVMKDRQILTFDEKTIQKEFARIYRGIA